MHTKKLYTAVFIAALFHVCGAAGILFTQYKQWFIDATPVTLLLMAALAVYTQKEKKAPFFIFLLLAFAAGSHPHPPPASPLPPWAPSRAARA